MDQPKERYTISTDKTKLNIPYIHAFLAQSYWAENIPVEIVQRSIEGAVCFGVYDDGDQIWDPRFIVTNY